MMKIQKSILFLFLILFNCSSSNQIISDKDGKIEAHGQNLKKGDQVVIHEKSGNQMEAIFWSSDSLSITVLPLAENDTIQVTKIEYSNIINIDKEKGQGKSSHPNLAVTGLFLILFFMLWRMSDGIFQI